MSYIPLVVGCERPLTIDDDEDLFVYLMSTTLKPISMTLQGQRWRCTYGTTCKYKISYDPKKIFIV